MFTDLRYADDTLLRYADHTLLISDSVGGFQELVILGQQVECKTVYMCISVNVLEVLQCGIN